MDGFSLLLLFLILWLVDRFLNAAVRRLRSRKALAEPLTDALEREGATVDIRQRAAPEELQGTTPRP